MSAEKIQKPDNCQEINLPLLDNLLKGLKVAGITKEESGLKIMLDNRKHNRIHLLIEPITEEDKTVLKTYLNTYE